MNKPGKSILKSRLPLRRRAALAVEPVEPRLLMTGLGFIGGYATHAGGAVDSGATVQLFNSGSSTVPFQTTTTNSDGYYHFDNLTPGAYQVAEVESGYATSSVSAITTINSATPTTINGNPAFQVTVVDPSTQNVTVTRNADPYTAVKTYYNLTGGPFNGYTNVGDTTHQYSLSLSGNAGNTSQIISLCTDLYHGVSPGAVYPTTPSLTPVAGLTDNIGRVDYLYNHFGRIAATDPNVGAGLQLAVWELLYDSPANLEAGNLVVDEVHTAPAVVTAAKAYLAASAGKSEDAYFLDVRTPIGDQGGQSMICTDLLNFTNCPVPSVSPGSISGFVYLDANNNGVKDGAPSPETGIGGVKVTAKAVINGIPITASAVTAPDGSYTIPNLVPGTYTLTESNVPAAYQPDITNTGSLAGVVVVAGANTPNENFGELLYTPGTPCPITSICYTDYGPCGTSYFSALGGNTHQGDQVTANFTVTSPVTVTLVTYTATSNFDLTKQAVFSVDTETLGVGKHSLTVTIPNGYYQIDLVCGGAIYKFNPSAGITYHGQNRFIDSDNGGCQAVSGPGALAGISGTVFTDVNGDGVLGSGDSGLGGVAVALTGTDVTGRPVTETRVTAADGTYSFLGLQPGTYAVREVTPSGYATTRNTVGTVNGMTDGKLSSPASDTISSIVLAAGNSGVGYTFGEQKATSCPLGCTETASMDWWAGCSGQSLIKGMNCDSNSTKLGHWLATECPNLFGYLDGKTNCQVAGEYLSQYNQCRKTPNAEVMATALAAYATDEGLAGCRKAADCGFTMLPGGSGNCTVDVKGWFSCYGGPQGKATLLQLLKFVDSESRCGSIGGSDSYLKYEIGCVLDSVNSCGTIGKNGDHGDGGNGEGKGDGNGGDR